MDLKTLVIYAAAPRGINAAIPRSRRTPADKQTPIQVHNHCGSFTSWNSSSCSVGREQLDAFWPHEPQFAPCWPSPAPHAPPSQPKDDSQQSSLPNTVANNLTCLRAASASRLALISFRRAISAFASSVLPSRCIF